MPNTLNLIAKRGETFNNYYVSYPLCCPSRVSLLTGRYAHNNGVKGNIQPNGGYFGFSFRAAYTHNLATWLQGAGYRTIHVGKFLNGYGDEPYSKRHRSPARLERLAHGAECRHQPLLLRLHAQQQRRRSKVPSATPAAGNPASTGPATTSAALTPRSTACPATTRPTADQLSPSASCRKRRPNSPSTCSSTTPLRTATSATRQGQSRRRATTTGSRARRCRTTAPKGFDEGNVSDKPRFIREAPYLSLADIHTYRVYYDKALESLRSIDDGVKLLLDTLGSQHRLRNTYVIFTSDNGFFYGEHRLIGGKFLAYEPSTHLPFLIRGPHIRAGTESNEVVGNIDIAPTVLELAGVEPDKSIDGRSMVPFLQDPGLTTLRPLPLRVLRRNLRRRLKPARSPNRATRAARSGTARARHSASATASILAPPKDYEGLRLGPYKYIAWPDGEKELYDLEKDPYELNNIVRIPNYFPVRNFLHRELLNRLEDCVGRICREEASEIPLTRKERQEAIRIREKERRDQHKEKQQESKEKQQG